MTRSTSFDPTPRVQSRALVTGATAGIGVAFAGRLASDGYDLVLVARNGRRLESLSQRLRERHAVDAQPLAADLTDPKQLGAVETRLERADVDLLVQSAGFCTQGPFAELDRDVETDEIRLNVLAVVRLSHAALAGMIRRGRGAIINVSSLAAVQPMPRSATYGATKAFVTSFTEALAEELRGTGVHIQALCPGLTRTELHERADIDTARLPDVLWSRPEQVVQASLAALARGQVICVPGLGNQLVAAVSSAAPRSLARRVAGLLVRRSLG